MLLLRLSGSSLLRLADRQFLPLLIHEPPRNTRFSPSTRRVSSSACQAHET
jgi:hypothetical protein